MDHQTAERIVGGLFAQVFRLTKIELIKHDTKSPKKLTSVFTPKDYTRFKDHEVRVELDQSPSGDWNYVLVVSGERLEKYSGTLKNWLDDELGNGVCVT